MNELVAATAYDHEVEHVAVADLRTGNVLRLNDGTTCVITRREQTHPGIYVLRLSNVDNVLHLRDVEVDALDIVLRVIPTR